VRINLLRAGGTLALMFVAAAVAAFGDDGRSIFVLTSTNDPSANTVVVFKLDAIGTPSLTSVDMLPTGGKGGASGNAGILQFKDNAGAVANFGSNTVTRLLRDRDYISVDGTLKLAKGCTQPDSVAIRDRHLFVVGANCAESHAWPGGGADGVVQLNNASAAQIDAGTNWAAVTLKAVSASAGAVLQLPLASDGALSGSGKLLTLPAMANNTPLGEAFWHDLLGFTPAHSPDSFAVVDEHGNISPIAGPTPPYPSNAPCWVAKGPGSVWYTANSPGAAISIFFTDGQGGVFYKSVSLPGSPTDITVSADRKYLAVIYTANGEAFVSVFGIDAYGDLKALATSSSVGAAAFSGVAISE